MQYISNILCSLVREDRLKHGLSQKKYADLFGISQPTISDIENNNSHNGGKSFEYWPDITTLCKFCIHFKRPIESFFTSK